MVKASAIVACVAAWMACTVNYKTDQLRCTTQSDCMAPRLCNAGYCTTDCPSDCNNGCDGSTTPPTCMVDGNGGNNSVTCPAGWQCQVECGQNNSCSSVDCTMATSCTITCDGRNSCSSVSCGTGSCDVTCNGPNSCNNIACSMSCACDVHCNNGSCNDTCPGSSCTDGNNHCSSDPSGCNTCP